MKTNTIIRIAIVILSTHVAVPSLHAADSVGNVMVDSNAPPLQFNSSFPTTSVQLLDSTVIGQWGGPYAWPLVAIHSMVLPTGKILQYSFTGEIQNPNCYVWDPRNGQFTAIPILRPLFCSGHSQLADGRILVTGGNGPAPEGEFRGIKDTHIFDPFSETWTRVEDMADGRWYPTNITLADGRVLVFSGLDEFTGNVNSDVELYEVGVGWQLVSLAQIPLYPLTFLRTTGDMFCAGPLRETFTLYVNNWTWSGFTFTNLGRRRSGTWAPLPKNPDQVMIIGGVNNNVVTATAEIINLADPNPAWQYAEPMNFARTHANAVILPDGTIFVSGGHGDLHTGNTPSDEAVMETEIYDPGTGQWSIMASLNRPRVYHSTAVLLPDARVLTAGTDGEYTGEIYSPPYLFRGSRPTIQFAPDSAIYGRSFDLQFTSATSTNTVCLIRLSAVTHSVNMDQRYVHLTDLTEIEVKANATVSIPAPADPAHAPPGYYMLFVVDSTGVPSEAAMLRLQEPTCDCQCHADPQCDSVTNVIDVTAGVNVAFRGQDAIVDPLTICPYETTDVNCDEVTNILDVVRLVNVAFRNADPAVEFCVPCT